MSSDISSPPIPDRRRINRIKVQGVPILMVDFSAATPDESFQMLEELPEVFEGQDLNSVRVLVDLSGVSYDSSASQKWRAALVKFNPYVRASAIYGANGLATAAIRASIQLLEWFKFPNAGKKIRAFKSRESALAWLLQI